jgi:hypothetical protein
MHERDQAPKLREELDRGQRAHPTGGERVVQARALQRSTGNRSVSALLAREPDDAKPGDKPERKAGGAGTATLPDIGAIPLTSVSLGSIRGSGATGPNSGSRSGETAVRDIQLTSIVGDHSPKLVRALSDGAPMAVVEVVVSGSLRLSLTNAFVSSYSLGAEGGEGQPESWSLNFESYKQS